MQVVTAAALGHLEYAEYAQGHCTLRWCKIQACGLLAGIM